MKYFYILLIFHFSFLLFNCFPQQPGWEIVPSGTTQELNSIFFYDYEVGFACGNSGTVVKSIDSGKTWQVLQTPIINDLNDLYVFNDSTILAVGKAGNMIFSVNGGTSWFISTYPLAVDFYSVSFSGDKGICGGSSQTILNGTFYVGAIAWLTVQTGFFGGGFWGAHMLSPQIGFVAGENSIFQPLSGVSVDSGHTWNFTAFYLNTNEGRATGVDFTDLNTGYVSARVWDGTGAIAKTTDSGLNWISMMFTNPLWSIDFPISSASQIGYAVGSQGTIIKTYNAGANWQPQISGTSLRLNKVHFKDFDFGFAVGENGLILRTTTGGEPVTFAENEIQSPISFELFQNYPNPFNPSTKIKFTIPSVETTRRVVFTTLKVYDLLGNEVATLVDEYKPAGKYEVEFNAISHSGLPSGEVRSLVSGIYFYEVRSNNLIQTKKMILLK